MSIFDPGDRLSSSIDITSDDHIYNSPSSNSICARTTTTITIETTDAISTATINIPHREEPAINLDVLSSSSSFNSSSSSLVSSLNPPSINNHSISLSQVPENGISSHHFVSSPLEDAFHAEDLDEDEYRHITKLRGSAKRANSSSQDEGDKSRSKLDFEFSQFVSSKTATTDKNSNITFELEAFNFFQKPLEKNPFDSQRSFFCNHRSVGSLQACKLISVDEMIQFLKFYYSSEISNVDTMFPWLHGIHKNNYGQISFLANKTNNCHNKTRIISFEKPISLEEDSEEDGELYKITLTPEVRCLMSVRSSNLKGEVSSDFTSIITESTGLIKGTVSADDILMPYPNGGAVELYLQSLLPRDIFELYSLPTLLRDCTNTQLLPVFKDMDPEIGINLRNFHIQVSKVSHISDLLVYCLNEDHRFCVNTSDSRLSTARNCKCVSLARLLHIAQVVYQKQHPEILICEESASSQHNLKKYNTFVLENPDADKFEKSDLLAIPVLNEMSSVKNETELCSEYDLKVFNNWDSNYLYRERLEISKMSTATPISDSIWFGNITDYECLQIQLNNGNDLSYLEKLENDFNSSNVPLHCDPKNTIVSITKKNFEDVDRKELDSMLITFPKAHWRIFVRCVEGARFPSLSHLRNFFANCYEMKNISIEFPPSGSVSMADMSDDDILSIINLCKLCYYRCNKEFPGLFYCSDGYTETSLFGLCYIMYAENIGLDEAISNLHLKYERPFFIFKTDYTLLGKLEVIMKNFSPLNNKNENMNNFVFEDNGLLIRSLLLRPKKRKSAGSVGSVGSSASGFGPFGSFGSLSAASVGNVSFITPTGHHIVQLRGQQNQQSPVTSPINLARGLSLQIDNGSAVEGCFEEVMGSLPSRILPHLYLGSLEHASSLPLLKQLEIEYLVSVGERVPWIDSMNYSVETTESGCEILTLESNQIDNRNSYVSNVKKIMRISNINDDGIGTLTTTINDAIGFVDECYNNNGKVLVHCQVGVSRSATVCIAEVIKRLNISLPRAYLYVRVRRLNVIIQPNLKLMYELFKWEEVYVKSRRKQRDQKLRIKEQQRRKKQKQKRQIQLQQSQQQSQKPRPSLVTRQRPSISGSFSSTFSSASTLFTSTYPSERSSISTTRGSFTGNNTKGLISKNLNSVSIMEEGNEDAVSHSDSEYSGVTVTSVDALSVIDTQKQTDAKKSSSSSSSSLVSSFANQFVLSSTPAEKENESGEEIKEEVKEEAREEGREEGREKEEEEEEQGEEESYDNEDEEPLIISNCPEYLREVDWFIFCREIYNLNRAYIKPN